MLGDPLAQALLAHPWIEAARRDADGVLHIRPTPAALAVRPAPGALLSEYLDHWGEVYDWTYSNGRAQAVDLDLSGWRATDSGRPLPVAHMTEWVDRTVELVLRARPRWVLELGCGTGMLMHRLLPHLRGYVGTDLAQAALTRHTAAALPGTAFVRAAAHEVSSPGVRDALVAVGCEGARPDCVLLNSVTQCFPNVDYLRAVVLDALALVAPGGTVVVGDVRHSALLESYSRWAEAAATPGLVGEELTRRAAVRAAREEELLFDPALLARIAEESRRSVRLSVHAKTMRDNTELTRYRFDAVLQADLADADVPETVSTRWEELQDGNRLTALRQRLIAGPARVYAIPNLLLHEDRAAVMAFQLREATAGLDAAVTLDLDDPTQLEVIAPSARAALPVVAVPGTGTAHEPLPGFLRRRLTEEAHRHLRVVTGGPSAVAIAVDLPGEAQ